MQESAIPRKDLPEHALSHVAVAAILHRHAVPLQLRLIPVQPERPQDVGVLRQALVEVHLVKGGFLPEVHLGREEFHARAGGGRLAQVHLSLGASAEEVDLFAFGEDQMLLVRRALGLPGASQLEVHSPHRAGQHPLPHQIHQHEGEEEDYHRRHAGRHHHELVVLEAVPLALLHRRQRVGEVRGQVQHRRRRVMFKHVPGPEVHRHQVGAVLTVGGRHGQDPRQHAVNH
mmetsp:Transcript_1232/g.2864  ORF Transcript_1232/g.2864 Transcript_1232/m.2864 type:complete len:230 (+) Transcript_1232:1111-1800(+)